MGIVASDAIGFATSGTSFPFGSSPLVGDIDLLGVNSDTIVSTPSGFTVLDSSVANQGSYLFYRIAVGGETDSVTITTSGDHDATAVWARIRAVDSIDKNAKAVATGSSSGTSPDATTATLSNTGELSISFVGIHRYAGATPTAPSWNNGYTGLEFATQGSGNPACAAFLGYKENVGTTAETVSCSWTNGAFDRDTYVVTFIMDTANPQTVSPSSIASGEALGTPSLQYNQTVVLSGISSGEAFGIAFINNGVRTSMDVQGELNRIAGTSGLGEAGAANVIAGTNGLDTVGALNTYVGNTPIRWLDLQGVANQMANTSGYGTAYALSLVDPV